MIGTSPYEKRLYTDFSLFLIQENTDQENSVFEHFFCTVWLWGVQGVGCLRCGMFGMRDVWDVGCY